MQQKAKVLTRKRDNLPLNPHQHAGQPWSTSRGGGGASVSSWGQRARSSASRTGVQAWARAHPHRASWDLYPVLLLPGPQPGNHSIAKSSTTTPAAAHHGRQLGTTTDHPPHRNSTPSVRSFSKNLTSSLWMMENLSLVAALAQRPAKGGKQWGRETRASETQKTAAARKGEQIRKTRLPIIDTVRTIWPAFLFCIHHLSLSLQSARLRASPTLHV